MLLEPMDEAKEVLENDIRRYLNSTKDFSQSLSLLTDSSGWPSAMPPQLSSDTFLSWNPTSNAMGSGLQKSQL